MLARCSSAAGGPELEGITGTTRLIVQRNDYVYALEADRHQEEWVSVLILTFNDGM